MSFQGHRTAVLHVYRTYFPDPPGGLQEAIRQLALSTQPYAIDNTIFALSRNPDPGILARPEARVVRCRSWISPASCDLGGYASFVEFAKLIRDTDIVHYLFPWPFADVLHALVKPKRPTVLTYISDVVRQRWLGKAYAPLMWSTLRSMRVIVANCPAYAETSPILSDPAIRDKVRVIPLGIEERSYAKEGDDSVLDRLKLYGDEPFFLFVGVLRYYKGLDFLLRGAKHVQGRIVIAGSGPEEKRLRSMADDLQAKNVVFAGQVSDAEKVALIKNCRALVLPSHLRSEAFGMVLVEAAMFSRPLVSCEIGTGTSYVNAHEETGFVVPPKNPVALAQAMNILGADAALSTTMGLAARERYDRLFSGRALGQAYSALYREIS